VALKAFSNEEYAKPDGIGLHFDLLHPGDGAVPLVVFLHGGGWISGDRTMYAEEAEWFSSQGFATAVFDYRLAPLYPFPSAVVDAQTFVRYVRENAARYGIDAARLAAMGNSAGGHLACMLGLCHDGFRLGGFEPINAVVDVCGLTDMRDPAESQYPISMSFIEQFLGGPYVGREALYASASPLTHVQQGAPPFLIVHGTDDDVVPPRQSQSLHEALLAAGGRSRLLMLEGEGHSFTMDSWERVRTESVEFLREALS
jgi:acetyl esterase/lipase